MEFVKMHGLGNDFVLFDEVSGNLGPIEYTTLAVALCDRHFGVGADGILLAQPSNRAEFRMRVFNPDGSEAEMCGNGIRCFAKYIYDQGLTQSELLTVETLAGIQQVEVQPESGKAKAVRVNMGEPRLHRREIPVVGEDPDSMCVDEVLEAGDQALRVTCVSMGNPHCVTFVPDADTAPVKSLGPLVENHPWFLQRTNVEFVQVLDRSHLRMRVWERGAGITLACGTGACACVVAAVLNDLAGRKATVSLLGGDLEIEWQEQGSVIMTGPAQEVFRGEISF